MGNVRHATEADFPVLLEFGRLMHAEAALLNHAPFDEEKVTATLTHAMHNGLVLVHQNDGEITGGFVGILGERWYSRRPMFMDLALFVRPERRSGVIAYRLITTVTEWCEAKGIDPRNVIFGVTTGVREHETGEFYRRMGMRPAGSLYQLGSY